MSTDKADHDAPTIDRHEECKHSLLCCPRCGASNSLRMIDLSHITRTEDDPRGAGNAVYLGDHGLLAHRVSAEHGDSMPAGDFTEIGFQCVTCDPQGDQIVYLRIRSENGTELSWHNPEPDDEPSEEEPAEPKTPELPN